jgi:hypothetical protein
LTLEEFDTSDTALDGLDKGLSGVEKGVYKDIAAASVDLLGRSSRRFSVFVERQ